jgi:hypothetical protein
MTSLVRRVTHYPRLFLPQAEDVSSDAYRLARRLTVRPGRFIVNNPHTASPDWRIPKSFLLSSEDMVAPLQAAVYLGRVEDITPERNYFVRVWEVPNGRVGTTTLTHEHLAGQEVAVGDTLRIYTWIEVPLSPMGEPLLERPRVSVEVTPRTPLSEDEREMLAKVLAALETDARPEDQQ